MRLRSVVFFCFSILLGLPVFAQDGHYWTQQYGTKSMLLSGSVIGGVSDLGAVFYNPGRLGLIENPAFLLSADVYEWTRLSVSDAFGESADVSKNNFGGVPSLVAGTFTLGFLENHHFAYAMLLRQGINADFSYKNELYGDVIENFPGEEYFSGVIRITQQMKEEWASLTWSYPFSEKVSVGVTTNLMIYSQNKGNVIELQALTAMQQTAMFRYNRNFNFESYGLLWKIGLATNFEKVLMGLTITTPVVGLRGKGNYVFEEFFSGIEGVSVKEDTYATSQQSNLDVTSRKPWSVGLGVTVPVNKSNIHLSGEWYDRVRGYTIMQAEDHVSQSSGDQIGFQLVDDLESVLNFGIGAEFYLNDKVSFYSSFCTDYSAVGDNTVGFVENKPIVSNTVFSTDYFHYGGGFVLKLKGVDLTLGTTYTGGKQDFLRPVDFPDEDDDGIFERDEQATLHWSRWRLVFSFSFKFLDQYADKLKDK